MTSITQRQFDGPGRVAFRECGQGAPLVLLHGVGMQSAAWAPQIAALSCDHRVLALDLPGHGGSAPLPGRPQLPDYVDWLHGVLEGLGLGPVCLVGHSMGAMIATGYAVTHPRHVRRVALLNGVYQRDPQARRAVIARAAEIRAGAVDLETPLDRWFGQDPDTDTDTETVRAQVRGWLAAMDPKGYADAYGAFAAGDGIYAPRIGEIAAPLLALTGALDPNSTPAMAQDMARAAPCGSAVVLDGARHMANLTVPEEVNTALTAWLRDGTAARRRA